MSLETIKINRLIETIKDNKNAMTLFVAFESLVLLNTLFYLFSEGQKQFGSAIFMTAEETLHQN